MGILDTILHDDESDIVKGSKIVKPKTPTKIDPKLLMLGVALFLVAFIARLYFIYFVSNPDNPGAGWFGDAYHHWQIAYLSREIGFHKSFLRLWDLKGMEFFWGLLHPLLTIAAFNVTGSISVGVERAMTAFFGSISVVLIYFICKRFWNGNVALAGAIFAALNPVGVFNDASGMIEPIGITFLLLGVYLWPKKPVWTGVSFAVALMARAEYWIFSIFLIGAMIIFSKKKNFDKKITLLAGFLVPAFLYMKYLLDYTNNAIYPFYWNYITNIFGTWQLKKVLEPQDILGKYIFLAILIVSSLAALLVLKKKPRGMYLYLLGIGNWIFLGVTFGVGAYIKSYMTYVWYVRFMIWPYAFIGILIAILLFHSIPNIRYIRVLHRFKLNWLIFLVILVVSQGFWLLIMPKYKSTNETWNQTMGIASNIAKHYKGGGLLLMEGNPEITYALVRFNGIQGKNIIGEMFDPYYYMQDDPYQNWGENRVKIMGWIKENNIRTIATYVQYDRYSKLAEHEPDYFSKPIYISNSNIVIYEVNEEKIQKGF